MAKYVIPINLQQNIPVKKEDSIKDLCLKILKQDVWDEEANAKVNAKLALCLKMYERAIKGDNRFMTTLINVIGEMPMSDSEKTVVVPMIVNNIPNG